MPLTKLTIRPGVNRENTRYTTEGGWFDSEKIRFRQGTPEKIGGWARISANTFLGICRSLWNWVTLGALNLMGVGTSLKFYIESGGAYYDITPIRSTASVANPFTATNGSTTLTVAHNSHGGVTGDFVTYSGAALTGLGGTVTAAVLKAEYQITVIDTNSYTITLPVTANATDAAGSPGGGTVVMQYQVNVGDSSEVALVGWGSGGWGVSAWGGSAAVTSTTSPLRVWNQDNFGEDLIFGVNSGAIYYWDATSGYSSTDASFDLGTDYATFTFAPTDGMPMYFTTTGTLPTGLDVGTVYYARDVAGFTAKLAATYGGAAINLTGSAGSGHSVSGRGYLLSVLPGASDVPTVHLKLLVSDVSRFVFAFGCNDLSATTLDPLLIRWTDQESAAIWSPAITNQAGSLKLSHGSTIIEALQTRQEVLVWTDAALYGLQYLGPPYVWGAQLLGDNLSIVSGGGAALASGTVYWMGTDKFYKYDGRVQTLRCDLRQYIYGDINLGQKAQIFSGTNEGFNEVWWFYPSAASTTIDKYVVYNYAEDIWYYGSMARTAWIDTALRSYPTAATYSNNLVEHENGLNDNVTGTPAAIESYVLSSEFDIADGHNFGFVHRMLPDITFRGSTAVSPTVTMTLYVLKGSGSGYTSPGSVGGDNSATVVRTVSVPVEEFTNIIYTRVRGRQMALKILSNQVDATWQLGAPRIDSRLDGRR